MTTPPVTERDDTQTLDFVYSPSMRRIIVVEAIAGCLSCTMVSLLLVHVFSVAVAPLCIRQTHKPDGERAFLRRQLGVFVVCLFFSDLFQSLSGMMQIRWASKGGIVNDQACTMQAVALLGGDLGTGFWNTVVAIHTFITIVLRRSVPNLVVICTVVIGWLYVIFSCTLGLLVQTKQSGPLYGIAGDWCFITNNYETTRLWIHYVPILSFAFIIFSLYALVFLFLSGHLIVNDGRYKFRWKAVVNATPVPEGQYAHVTAIAKKMLWYPISYITLVLPLTIARLAELHGDHVPEWFFSLSISVIYLSGFTNVIIYTTTRRILQPVHWSRSLAQGSTRAGGVRNKSVRLFGDKVPQNTDYTIWITREQEAHYSFNDSKGDIELAGRAKATLPGESSSDDDIPREQITGLAFGDETFLDLKPDDESVMQVRHSESSSTLKPESM